MRHHMTRSHMTSPHMTPLGSVRVCQFESSEILCHVKYPGGGSSLIWAPLSVDSSGLTLVAGFTDGVVRYSM